jgi:hypothetical protein
MPIELHALNDVELIRYVDQANPEVKELVKRIQELRNTTGSVLTTKTAWKDLYGIRECLL